MLKKNYKELVHCENLEEIFIINTSINMQDISARNVHDIELLMMPRITFNAKMCLAMA
jgi:hypothetical protein